MRSIYQLKPHVHNLQRPGVKHLYDRGVGANQVTLTVAMIALLLGSLLATFHQHAWLFALIPLWMLLRMTLNAMDGMLAREFGQQSKLGAYLNKLSNLIAASPCICRSPYCSTPSTTACSKVWPKRPDLPTRCWGISMCEVHAVLQYVCGNC